MVVYEQGDEPPARLGGDVGCDVGFDCSIEVVRGFDDTIHVYPTEPVEDVSELFTGRRDGVPRGLRDAPDVTLYRLPRDW